MRLGQKLWSVLVAAGLGLALVPPSGDALAQGKKKKEEAPAAEPPVTKKAITLPLAGVSWGQSPKTLADAIDKVLDEDYRPLYKEVQPGVMMKALDAELAEKKNEFRRSRIDFGKTPTGIDATPLKGEYTYNNKEALYSLDRKNQKVYFFMIQDKLWKIIEEHKLSESSPVGKTYQDAVVKLSTFYGIPGRVLPADATRVSVEVDWKDSTTHLRVIQRSETALAFAFEDIATVANLSTLRTNKPTEDNGIDPDVAAAVRGAPPPPPPDKDKNKKK